MFVGVSGRFEPKWARVEMRRNWLAETPPAKTMDWISEWSLRARSIFSRRISIAVCSKEAAMSAFC